MADTLALAALVRKQAELAGDIENAHAALKRMVGQLEHLDAALRLFDPDIRTESIRPKAFRPPADGASRREMTRIALGVLRRVLGRVPGAAPDSDGMQGIAA